MTSIVIGFWFVALVVCTSVALLAAAHRAIDGWAMIRSVSDVPTMVLVRPATVANGPAKLRVTYAEAELAADNALAIRIAGRHFRAALARQALTFANVQHQRTIAA